MRSSPPWQWDEESTWVIGDLNEPSLWRIDARTGRLAQTIRLPYAPKDVAVGAGGVWVTSQLADRLVRVDPATGQIMASVPTGRGAAGVAVGAGSVWVANAVDGTVSRFDPHTLRVIQTIAVEGTPDDVAVGDGSVWVVAQTLSGRRRGVRATSTSGSSLPARGTTASRTTRPLPAPSCR